MLSITAIIAVHNGAETLGRVLQHLSDNRIEAILIDHGSSDGLEGVIEYFKGRPITRVVREPFDGSFSLSRMLDIKEEVVGASSADWVIHLDADEIPESPRTGETLREFIHRVDAAGYDLVDCDEFVFCPAREEEDYSGTDFVELMRRYYFFSPANRTLHRIVKRSAKAGLWGESGGHRLKADSLKVAPEKARLRHYIGLSLDHLRSQYLSRVFVADALRRGWHRKRVAMNQDLIATPSVDRLFDLDNDGWRTDRPEQLHLVFRQEVKYVAPAKLEASPDLPPMPFIVGVGRSGTTLLRLLLDAHPELAVTPETHWLRPLLPRMIAGNVPCSAFRDEIIKGRSWDDLGIPEAALDAAMARNLDRPAAFLRDLYGFYASRLGASRAGDKTPLHGLAMHQIAMVLPEARFIHIIRDGRDVAASYKGLWFGPGDDIHAMAIMWMWRIREMRQQAQFLPHYLEVRYEDLVTEPERVLKRVGEFIELPFDPAQLRSHLRADERLRELQDVEHRGELISAERRRSIFGRTSSPPDSTRIGRWREELSLADLDAFEHVAGDMLTDLGYRRNGRKKWWPNPLPA